MAILVLCSYLPPFTYYMFHYIFIETFLGGTVSDSEWEIKPEFCIIERDISLLHLYCYRSHVYHAYVVYYKNEFICDWLNHSYL